MRRVAGQERPRVTQALLWHKLVNASVASKQREWLLTMGQRSAYERIPHLPIELFLNLREVGLTDGQSCELPTRQTDIAEATGLTSLHDNRMLQNPRSEGLIELAEKRLTVLSLDKLEEAALFNPNSLHLIARAGISMPTTDPRASPDAVEQTSGAPTRARVPRPSTAGLPFRTSARLAPG